MAGVNPLLVLTVATFGLLIAVTFGILISRDWYDYKPTLRPEPQSVITTAIESPVVWAISFVLVGLLMAAAAGFWAVNGSLSTVVIGLIGALIGLMVFAGVWEAIRTRGRSNSEAVAVGAIVLALLFVLAITIQLVIG